MFFIKSYVGKQPPHLKHMNNPMVYPYKTTGTENKIVAK
jgi:hypothetical protein